MKRDSAISYYFRQKDILSLLIFSKGTTVSRDLLKLSIALYRKSKREDLKDGNETCYYVCHGKGGTDKKNGGLSWSQQMLCSFSHHRQVAGIIQDSIKVFQEMNSYSIYSIQLYIYINIQVMSVDTVYACVYCPLMQKPQLTLESQANCFHPDSNVVGNILKIPQLNYLTQSECSSCHAKIFEPQTLKFKAWVT